MTRLHAAANGSSREVPKIPTIFLAVNRRTVPTYRQCGYQPRRLRCSRETQVRLSGDSQAASTAQLSHLALYPHRSS